MLEANGLFDETNYLALYPDVAQAVAQGVFQSGAQHFQSVGRLERRNPSGLFSEEFYLSEYSDVAQAVQAGAFISGLDHFIQIGQQEDRSPSVFFNPSFYLGFYSDVQAAIANGGITPIEHFVKFGQFENRDPITEFYTNDYLQLNQDVAQAVQASFTTSDPLSPIEHFIEYGQYENRLFGPDFDPNYYLQENPDVAALVRPNGLSAIQHFLQFGKQEGRPGIPPVSISLEGARDLGTVGSTVINDFVGDTNFRDIYSFNLATFSSLNLTLDGLSADADLYLVQDINGNGSITSDELIDLSATDGTTTEEINVGLPAGTYFVLVEQYQGDTNYNLSLSTRPIATA